MNKFILLVCLILPIVLAGSDTPCCIECTLPAIKMVSVDMTGGEYGHCGETCLEEKYYDLYKIFEWNLTIADYRCADEGFPIFNHVEVHGIPPLISTFDLYDPIV